MLDRQTVVEYLSSLSQDEIAGLLLGANVIPHGDGAAQTTSKRILCPHCGSHNINRYNALFQIAYRSIESKIALLIEKLFRPGCTMNIHTVKDIATHNLWKFIKKH